LLPAKDITINESYKISIKNEDKNLKIEGSDKEWVEGNFKQFLVKIVNENVGQMIESRALKRIIGIIWFILSIELFFVSLEFIQTKELQRFLYSCAFGWFGIFCRTFIYYGFLRKDQTEWLDRKKIRNCRLAYFMYYPLGLLAVTSFIFIFSYKQLVSMKIELFYPVAFFLFSALGFAVLESLNKFLLKIDNK